MNSGIEKDKRSRRVLPFVISHSIAPVYCAENVVCQHRKTVLLRQFQETVSILCGSVLYSMKLLWKIPRIFLLRRGVTELGRLFYGRDPASLFLNQIQLLISFFLCFSPLFIAICLHVKITKKFSSNICFDIKEISEREKNFWGKSCERGLQGEEKCAEYSLGA